MADRNIEANPLSSLFIKTRPLQMNTATTSSLLAGEALSPTVPAQQTDTFGAVCDSTECAGFFDFTTPMGIYLFIKRLILHYSRCVAVLRRRVSQPNGQKHTRRWLPGYYSPNEANACKVRITFVSGLTLSNNHFC
jgi:hypothetical protein